MPLISERAEEDIANYKLDGRVPMLFFEGEGGIPLDERLRDVVPAGDQGAFDTALIEALASGDPEKYISTVTAWSIAANFNAMVVEQYGSIENYRREMGL